jgi:hypothetical protein
VVLSLNNINLVYLLTISSNVMQYHMEFQMIIKMINNEHLLFVTASNKR